MLKRTLLTALCTVLLATTACDDDDGLGPGDDHFVATLVGTEEVPPVTTNTTGNATVTIGDSVGYFLVNVQNATAITQAHIHVAPRGQNGGIIVDLFLVPAGVTSVNVANGTLAEGTFRRINFRGAFAGVSMDSLRSLMRSGNTYVNVHTTSNPAGLIRGQLLRP